jgi:hypothetical protein
MSGSQNVRGFSPLARIAARHFLARSAPVIGVCIFMHHVLRVTLPSNKVRLIVIGLDSENRSHIVTLVFFALLLFGPVQPYGLAVRIG